MEIKDTVFWNEVLALTDVWIINLNRYAMSEVLRIL